MAKHKDIALQEVSITEDGAEYAASYHVESGVVILHALDRDLVPLNPRTIIRTNAEHEASRLLRELVQTGRLNPKSH